MSNLEGAILSDYFLLQCINKSGVADVYRARQNGEGNHEVAVKIFRSGYTQRETFRDYFMMEAEKIGQLEHPYILPLLEFGEGEVLYVVMPYVATGTLEDLLKRVGGKLSAVQAVPLMQQLCSAMQYAHSRGIVHGNLKPSNVFVAAHSRILLSDFSIAQGYDDSQQSLTSMGWGSAEYASPEQSLGVLNRSSDIYSLGVLLYRMLAGQPPFVGQMPVEVLLKHARQAPPSVRTIVPDISDAVDGVLQMALQKQGDHRFSTAEELGNAFFSAVTVAPVTSMVARPLSIMMPQASLAQPSGIVEPRTPVPAGKQTPPPLHAQSWPRITRQLSPSLALDSSYPGNVPVANIPQQSSSNMAAKNVPEPPYFGPGIAVGRQHFWSAEPVEWSPMSSPSSLQGTSTLKNDVPLNAGDYLQDKADVIPARSTSSSLPQTQCVAPVVSLDVSIPVSSTAPTRTTPATSTTHAHIEEAGETENAFAVRLRKLLPVIVVLLLLLGLLGAFLSSFFFPASSSGATGAGVIPLHSISGILTIKIAHLREMVLWAR